MASTLKSLDFYRLMPRELTEPSVTGASCKDNYFHQSIIVSVISMTFVAFLIIYQMVKFLTLNVTSELMLLDPRLHSRSSENKVNRELINPFIVEHNDGH